jgi:hypothetical protein
MHIRPASIGLILFALLAIGGAIDGIRRQFTRDPIWAMQNWRSILKGVIGWCAVGGLAITGAIVAAFL